MLVHSPPVRAADDMSKVQLAETDDPGDETPDFRQ